MKSVLSSLKAPLCVVPFSSSLSLSIPPGAFSALDILGFAFSLLPGEGCVAVFGMSCFPFFQSFPFLCLSGFSVLSCNFLAIGDVYLVWSSPFITNLAALATRGPLDELQV